MRTTQTYRDNLDALKEAFPDKRALNVTDLSRYLGKSLRSTREWWVKWIGDRRWATRETIARYLS